MKPAHSGYVRAFMVLGIAILITLGCGDDEEDAARTDVPIWTGDPVVQTLSGTVRGFEEKANTWVWKAIPFAKPPVGPLRWKAPQDPDPWAETREESEYCSPCTQYAFFYRNVIGSEDCLYLNVWRPQTAETNLPVYFWIHGGGNSAGSAWTTSYFELAEDYSGANLASISNFVFVSANYRLGPLGWFTHPALREGVLGREKNDSGNYGTLDLIKALTWIQGNIEAFGGDPNKVMIAGQSAGGFNVQSLLASPLAQGLFPKGLFLFLLGDPVHLLHGIGQEASVLHLEIELILEKRSHKGGDVII